MKYIIYFKSGNTSEISEEVFKSIRKSYDKYHGEQKYTRIVEMWDDLVIDLYQVEAIIPLRAEQREKLLTITEDNK